MLLVLGLATLSGGCAGDDPGTAPQVRSCLAEWNAPENKENRALLAATGFVIGTVSEFQIDHAAPDLTGTGCSYLLRNPARYVTFGGVRRHDGELRWNVPPMVRGRWSYAQESRLEVTAVSRADGTLVSRPPGRVPTAPPRVPPPPAWVETEQGPRWLDYSTLCWPGAGCRDYVGPRCGNPEHVRHLALRRGGVVRFHLGWVPRELFLVFDGGRTKVRLDAVRSPTWTVDRGGPIALIGYAKAGGDTSYVACIELR